MQYNIKLSKYTGTAEQFQTIARQNSMQFAFVSSWNFDTTYAIYANGELVGFLDFYIDKTRNGIYYANIDVIDLFLAYRGKGVGKAVLTHIFETPYKNKYTIANIYGEAFYTAISWWFSVGANFEMSATKLKTYIQERYSAAFCLNRKKFLANNVSK